MDLIYVFAICFLIFFFNESDTSLPGHGVQQRPKIFYDEEQTNKQTKKERTEWSAVKNIERREKKRKKSGEERQNKKNKKGMTGAREKESDLTR